MSCWNLIKINLSHCVKKKKLPISGTKAELVERMLTNQRLTYKSQKNNKKTTKKSNSNTLLTSAKPLKVPDQSLEKKINPICPKVLYLTINIISNGFPLCINQIPLNVPDTLSLKEIKCMFLKELQKWHSSFIIPEDFLDHIDIQSFDVGQTFTLINENDTLQHYNTNNIGITMRLKPVIIIVIPGCQQKFVFARNQNIVNGMSFIEKITGLSINKFMYKNQRIDPLKIYMDHFFTDYENMLHIVE